MTDPLGCSWVSPAGNEGTCRKPVAYRIEQLLSASEVALTCRAHLGQLVAEALDEVENALGVVVDKA